jgi:hypothetical protein
MQFMGFELTISCLAHGFLTILYLHSTCDSTCDAFRGPLTYAFACYSYASIWHRKSFRCISSSRTHTSFVTCSWQTRHEDQIGLETIFSWWRILLASLQDDVLWLQCYYFDRCCVGQCACISSSLWVTWRWSEFCLACITLCPYWPIAIIFWTTRWIAPTLARLSQAYM